MGMKLEKSWYKFLAGEVSQPYVQNLKEFLNNEQQQGMITFPPDPLVFAAFRETPLAEVKVVIVGQDPYHGTGQAEGLSFSVPLGMTPPPSLKNIYKELQNDLGIPPKEHGSLLGWARQGVLLLNATLTVRRGEPRSHYGKGWERFTDAVIQRLYEKEDPIVFILWGKSAQEKVAHVREHVVGKKPHLILTAAHPSPYSATQFFGCRHFSKANQFLQSVGKKPIDWGAL